MSFPFNFNIPAAGNNPSDDQPEMLQNNQSSNSMWNVDHVSYNNNAGGKHKQVTFNTQNVAGAQVDPESVLYTNAGSASTNSQLYFRNADETFLVNPVRAFGVFTTSAAVASLNNSYNVTSISGDLDSVTVVLDTNAVTGNNIVVFTNFDQTSATATTSVRWSFTNPNLTLSKGGGFTSWNAGRLISFVVLQA